MASAEREPIMGVWGQSPQRGPGAEPLVRGRSPPEAESFLSLERPTQRQNVARFRYFAVFGRGISAENVAWYGFGCRIVCRQFKITASFTSEGASRSTAAERKLLNFDRDLYTQHSA